jgi:cytosine/adenosine deaminase-related metal-dependent hydrolase
MSPWRRPTVTDAADVGLGGRIGSLTPGKQADIVAIRAEDTNNLPLNNAVGTVVQGTDTRNVDTVFAGLRVAGPSGGPGRVLR